MEQIELNDSIHQLNIIDYSDKSIVVFGSNTKTFKEQLKALGGRFNPNLKVRDGFEGGVGWIFSNKNRDTVLQFIEQANEGKWASNRIPIEGEETSSNLPQVILPDTNSTYQTVKWRVFKPVVGMVSVIKTSGTTLEGKVVKIDTHKDFVDTVYVSIEDKISKLVICNGRWVVWGYAVEHTVKFT